MNETKCEGRARGFEPVTIGVGSLGSKSGHSRSDPPAHSLGGKIHEDGQKLTKTGVTALLNLAVVPGHNVA
jgi:hypothetical protein